uniref:DNA mismatch repair proteins mutS family domain-containing protein n=1 Tax=viral metagenome TaxID=1070528 RepID=A0A6C0B1L7_9ZZZZ
MALVKDYLDKTKQYIEEYGKNTLVLMQVGAFFEVYGLQNKNTGEVVGSEIQQFSTLCDLNIADKKICVGKDNVIMAGFSHYMIDKYLKRLQECGFTVIVFTQDEQHKNSTQTTRSLNGIYSPGTYFSLESTTSITNNTTCIWIHVTNELIQREKQMYMGIANIDIYTGKTTIFEYKEQYMMNPTTFDDLERFISIHQPSEVIFIGNILEKDMDTILHYGNIQCKCIHKISTFDGTSENSKRVSNCEKQTFQKTILETFYTVHDFNIFYEQFYENTIATQAFCYLLDFIYQHNPNLVKKVEEPIFDNHGERLILANHSLKQLNIIEDGTYSGKYSSVEKMLNMCSTPMGKRKFTRNLLHPTTNCDYLNEEYNITEHILTNFSTAQTQIKQRLTFMKDLSKISRQLMMKKISPKTLYQFYNNVKLNQELYDTLMKDRTILSYIEKRLGKDASSKIQEQCDEIIQFMDERLLLPLCEDIDVIQNFETNFIKHGVDDELDNKKQLYLEACNKLETIRQYLSKIIASQEKKSKNGTDHVKLHETEKNSFSLLATKRRCKYLLDIIQKTYTNDEKQNGIQLEYIASEDGTEKKIFTIKLFDNLFFSNQTASNDSIYNQDITELCKLISSIKIQMKDLITSAFHKVVIEMEQFQVSINNIIEFITAVDMIFTKAHIARTYHYCKPSIQGSSDKSFVDAKNLRHCLIEHLQQNELYVSNDIHLGNEEVDGILLYGTNAVGKTSFIRALGIAVIMAQAGLYVPCSAFTFFPYQTIFTRILGNDNMFKNLSSFAVEMYELRTILRLANENSMVLGDELCSGTESISATSIFVAGIQQLHAKKSSFIFATHLHEIIHYEELTALNTVQLKHMAVVYDRERDLLLYDRKIKSGPGNNMYGLEVCKSLHLPSDFIEAAHQIRMKYHPVSESLLSLKPSHFNSQKIVGLCEMCGNERGKETHHLQHQMIAGEDGYIQTNNTPFHKDHAANLLSLCEKCHESMHKEKKSMHKKVKTTKGTIVMNINI